MLDIGTFVSWIQVGLWTVAVIAFIVKVQRGEARMPRILNNNLLIGVVIALGTCGSIASVYLHYAHPRIVEKIVEKAVTAPCPEQKSPDVTPIPGAKPSKKNGHVEADPLILPKVGDSSQSPQTVVNAPGGIPIVGNQGTVNNPTVNNFGVSKQWLHISEGQREQLVPFLAKAPGKGELLIVASADSDTYKFTEQLREILRSAQWDVSSDIGTSVRSGPPLIGVAVAFHGDPAPGARITMTPDTPQGVIVIALQSLGISITGERRPNIPEGTVRITIGAPPD
jgi:hypothetical protein